MDQRTLYTVPDEWLEQFGNARLRNELLQLPFHGASYCGRGRIEELDISEMVLVIKVGGDEVDRKYLRRIGALPGGCAGSSTRNPKQLPWFLTNLRGSLLGTGEKMNELNLGPAAAGALNMVDVEVLFGTNYVVVDTRHRGAASAYERIYQHGMACHRDKMERKRKKATD